MVDSPSLIEAVEQVLAMHRTVEATESFPIEGGRYEVEEDVVYCEACGEEPPCTQRLMLEAGLRPSQASVEVREQECAQGWLLSVRQRSFRGFIVDFSLLTPCCRASVTQLMNGSLQKYLQCSRCRKNYGAKAPTFYAQAVDGEVSELVETLAEWFEQYGLIEPLSALHRAQIIIDHYCQCTSKPGKRFGTFSLENEIIIDDLE